MFECMKYVLCTLFPHQFRNPVQHYVALCACVECARICHNCGGASKTWMCVFLRAGVWCIKYVSNAKYFWFKCVFQTGVDSVAVAASDCAKLLPKRREREWECAAHIFGMSIRVALPRARNMAVRAVCRRGRPQRVGQDDPVCVFVWMRDNVTLPNATCAITGARNRFK